MAGIVKREFVVSRYTVHPYGADGGDEDRTETISLLAGSAELAQLDRMIAAAQQTRAERATRDLAAGYQRYQPTSPAYEPAPSSP